MKNLKIIICIISLFLLRIPTYSQDDITISLNMIKDTLKNNYLEIIIENNLNKGIAINSNLNSFYNIKLKNNKGQLLDNSWWFSEKKYRNSCQVKNNKSGRQKMEVYFFKINNRVPHGIISRDQFSEVLILKESDYKRFKRFSKLHNVYEDKLIYVIPQNYIKSFYIEANKKATMRYCINWLVDSGEYYSITYEIEDPLVKDTYKKEQINSLKGNNIEGYLVKSLYHDFYYFKGLIKSNELIINKNNNHE